MATSTPARVGPIERGFPHLEAVRESIRLLHKTLPRETIDRFTHTLAPAEVAAATHPDVVTAVHAVAGAVVRHLRLPAASVVVCFREMDSPGRVELTPDDTYLVDLHPRYRLDRRDVPAILAHEVTHVFLHRHGLRLPDTLANELLTDTTAAYLGVGWLCLDAYRITSSSYARADRTVVTETREEKLGYLTPEEFGYVLGKRALAFGDDAAGLLTSAAARAAFVAGSDLARRDHARPPLARCGWWGRWGYAWNRRRIRRASRATGLAGPSRPFGGGYQFEPGDPMRVIFPCPVCGQKLRLPTGLRTDARCGRCGRTVACRT